MLSLHPRNILIPLLFIVPQLYLFSASSHISVLSYILSLTSEAKQLKAEKELFLIENLQL